MKKLSFDDKLSELYNFILENGNIVRKDKFSDGVLMYFWFYNNLEKIRGLSSSEASKIMEWYKNKKDKFEVRKKELYDFVIRNNRLPSKSDTFADGINMYNFVRDNKQKLIECSFTGDEEGMLISDYLLGIEQEKYEEVLSCLEKYNMKQTEFASLIQKVLTLYQELRELDEQTDLNIKKLGNPTSRMKLVKDKNSIALLVHNADRFVGDEECKRMIK